MEMISLAEAKARLSELIDRVEAGDTIDITRRGRRVARLVAATPARKPVDIGALKTLTDTLPRAKIAAAELVRRMRDDGF